MAKGSGPIQYNDLFANDVQNKLNELNAIATTLDYSFQELAKSITGMSGRVNVNIKSNASTLKEMAASLHGVDVAAQGANTTLTNFAKDTEAATTKARALKDQQEGLKKVFDLSTASVDQIKERIKKLTADYMAMSGATNQNNESMQRLAKKVVELKGVQEQLTGALNKTKTAIVAADGSYNQLSQRLLAAKKELLAMPNAVDKATGALNKNNQAAVMLQREITMLDGSVKKFDATLGMHGRKVGNYTGAIGGAINQLAQFALGYISIQAAMQAVTATFSTAVKTDSIRAALGFIFKSTEVADQKLQMLQKTADRLGLEFVSLADSYKSFAGAAVASNFPIAQTEKIFNAVANAGAKLRLTSDQMAGALLALQQMISKGTVQAEELRGQLGERLPGAFSIAARAMGVTEQELGKLLKSGDVLAADLLPKLADELNRTFGGGTEEKVNSLQGSVNRLKNTFSEMISGNTNISKFFSAAIDGITTFATDITDMINSKSWKEFIFYAFPHKAGTKFDRGDADMTVELLSQFGKLNKTGQQQLIKDMQIARDRAFARTTSGQADDNLFYVEQAKALMALKKAYDELYNAKQPVIEQEEKEDKKAEKQLNALELLQQKIKEITLELNLQVLAGIQAGKAIAVDPKVLSDLGALTTQLEKLNNVTMGDIMGLTPLKGSGGTPFSPTSSLPTSGGVTAQNLITPLPYDPDALKNALDKIIPSLRESNALIGELFGVEFGNLFDGLTTNLENFLNESGNDFEDWANVGKAAIGSINEASRQATEYRIEQLNLEKQAQIDIAGTNAVARLAIEKEYNDKIKAEKKKQAQIDKAAAVFEIAINTAVAISKTLAETALFGIPLIPIIAALGAVQIAAVLARPIPGFKHGTQSAPEGFAQVAEDGAELIENKRGLRIAHKRQVTYLERGDKVFTAEQTRKILDTSLIDSNTELHGRLANNLHQTRRAEQIRDMAIAFRQDPEAIGDAVGRRIKDLPIHQTYFDERGVSRYIRTNGTRTKYLDDRFSLK